MTNTGGEKHANSDIYFGFPIDQSLLADLVSLEDNPDLSVSSKSKALGRSIRALLDASMDVFFIKPLGLVEADPAGEKIVRFGVSAVKRIIGVLIRTLIHTLEDDELNALIHHLSSMLHKREKDPADDALTYVSICLPTEIDQMLTESMLQLSNDGAPFEDARHQFKEVLLQITHLSIDIFFREPLELLRLNFVARKVASKAVRGTEHNIQKIIERVFGLMRRDQLQVLADYLGDLRFADRLIQKDHSKL